MLKIKNISRTFDGVKAVDDFSLTAEEKEITRVVGPDGGGKSTLLNIVTGFLARKRRK